MTAGVDLGYSRGGTTTGHGRTSNIYQLQLLARSKAKFNVPNSILQDFTDSPEDENLVLGNAIQISVGCRTSPHDYHESASITSHDSRQIMIKQEVKITVG